MWELFDPIVGTPVRTVPTEKLARWLARRHPCWDYARRGQGWLDPEWVADRRPDWQLVRLGVADARTWPATFPDDAYVRWAK